MVEERLDGRLGFVQVADLPPLACAERLVRAARGCQAVFNFNRRQGIGDHQVTGRLEHKALAVSEGPGLCEWDHGMNLHFTDTANA